MSNIRQPMEAIGNPIRTYVLRTCILMLIYIGLNVAAIFGVFDGVQAPGSYFLGLAVSLPIMLQMWSALDYINKADEYISGLMVGKFILSAGGAIALFSGWGFLESYAGAPHIHGWFVYPLFWFLFGVASLLDLRRLV